ncbi:MAG TPA: branched-chain amino acid transport system II carrier protein [Parachlamydiaceae bacterium]|nr:branched-chain amino acid transport system II carrier protein [Parachlamydiaceae bacterium]
MIKNNLSIIAAGFALFSMFFGAGDLIWPLILGGNMGDKNLFAMLGLLITGVSLPLLGLLSMMLFDGDYRSFFGRLGKVPSVILIFIIQAILGPIGSIPRLITLSYATLKPYMPEDVTLLTFSILACLGVLAFTIKKQRMIDLLGLVLTPVLIVALGFILILGLMNPPEAFTVAISHENAFKEGLNVGYNTLDLIASFIFAPLVLSHFREENESESLNPVQQRRSMFKKMLKASILAASLLSMMFIGLTFVASYYTPFLTAGHAPESRLSEISLHLLGPTGAIFSCIAVAMACLTTAIPLTSICADYIKNDLMKSKKGDLIPLLITLGISAAIANLGFTGIANMLSPVLHILCPGLIVLSILNIIYRLYEVRPIKRPVFAAFGLSLLGHFFR